METLVNWLSSQQVLVTWLVLDALCVALVWYDLWRNNAFLGSLMKAVWVLTVLYSGPIGLAIYWFTGRGQISRDSLSRRSFRSTAHCYSGCGAGEVVGVVVTAGLLGWTGWTVSIVTFLLAYIFGYAFTVGPLLQSGETLKTALKDSFVAETASITVMEVTAIGVARLLGGKALITEPLFWGALILSLSVGLFAALPVNAWLIHAGFKEGMHDPRHMMHGHHGGGH